MTLLVTFQWSFLFWHKAFDELCHGVTVFPCRRCAWAILKLCGSHWTHVVSCGPSLSCRIHGPARALLEPFTSLSRRPLHPFYCVLIRFSPTKLWTPHRWTHVFGGGGQNSYCPTNTLTQSKTWHRQYLPGQQRHTFFILWEGQRRKRPSSAVDSWGSAGSPCLRAGGPERSPTQGVGRGGLPAHPAQGWSQHRSVLQ